MLSIPTLPKLLALFKRGMPPALYSDDENKGPLKEGAALVRPYAIARWILDEVPAAFFLDGTSFLLRTFLSRWERVLRLPTRPTDSDEERSARVRSVLSRKIGYDRTRLAATLAPTLGIDAGDVVFHEVLRSDIDPAMTFTQSFVAELVTTYLVNDQFIADDELAVIDTSLFPDAMTMELVLVIDPGGPDEEYVVASETHTGTFVIVYTPLAADHPAGTAVSGPVMLGRAIPVGDQLVLACDVPWPSLVDDTGVRLGIEITAPSAAEFEIKLRHVSGAEWTVVGLGDLSGSNISMTASDRVTFKGLPAAGPWALSIDQPAGSQSYVTGWNLCVSNDTDARQIYTAHIQRDPVLGVTTPLADAQRLVDRAGIAHVKVAIHERYPAICDDPNSICDRDPVGA